MSTAPRGGNSAGGAINLTSTATHQFAVWYDLAGECRIGRITRGTHEWGINHQEYTVAGAPRTALAMPAPDDEHNYPTIAVDGLGRLHVWANTRSTVLRYIRSVDPHSNNTWLADAGWVSAGSELTSSTLCTYPMPVALADGTLWFEVRTFNNGPGVADHHYWTRGPSATTWSTGTMLFQGSALPISNGSEETDFAPYWAQPPVVESARGPHPGRMHLCWAWRVDVGAYEQILPSYAYSDNNGTTWRAIDGTALSMPITPLNTHAAARITGGGAGGALITAISRAGNSVLAEVDSANHGIVVGDTVTVNVEDGTYDGTHTVQAVLTGPDRIGWFQVAADDPAGGLGSITKRKYGGFLVLDVDLAGLPHLLNVHETGTLYSRRNATNTGWVESAISNPLGGFIRYHPYTSAVWLRDQLWGLAIGPPAGFYQNRLWKIADSPFPSVCLSGYAGPRGYPTVDPEARRRFGTVEVLTPDGDWPRVYTFGNQSRLRAA